MIRLRIKPIKMVAFILLALFVLSAFSGCVSSGKSKVTETTTVSTDPNTPTDRFEYPEGVNFAGRTFNILNCPRDQWNLIAFITTQGYNTEEVNDAIYERNELVKSKLNCNIAETHHDIYKLDERIRMSVSTGDEVFDAAYQQVSEVLGGIISGNYVRLDEIATMDLNKPYYAQEIQKATSINSAHYSAASNLHLMGLDALYVVYFNADYLAAKDIEAPYDEVRAGTWTIDRLYTLAKEAAELNADDSFAWNEKGTSVYGMTAFPNGIPMFMYGVQALMAAKDSIDRPYLSSELDPDFITKTQTLSSFIGEAGTYYSAGPSNAGLRAYDRIFIDQRAAFVGAAIQYGQKLRNAVFNYGILPFPKYDVTQKDYASTSNQYTLVATIPRNNNRPQDIGLIIEALSYESDRTVLGPYFDKHVSAKGTRSDADKEMLNIVKNTRGFDIYTSVGLGDSYRDAVVSQIIAGSQDIKSTVVKYAPNANKVIAELLKVL